LLGDFFTASRQPFVGAYRTERSAGRRSISLIISAIQYDTPLTDRPTKNIITEAL